MPLREAHDWLAVATSDLIETHLRSELADPWAAREAYVDVLLGKVEAVSLSPVVRDAMAMEHHRLVASQSCGWFFSDAAGVEPILGLRHALRAMELARSAFGVDLVPGFKAALAGFASNDPLEGGLEQIWTAHVAPAAAVGADLRLASLASDLLASSDASAVEAVCGQITEAVVVEGPILVGSGRWTAQNAVMKTLSNTAAPGPALLVAARTLGLAAEGAYDAQAAGPTSA